MNWPQRKRVYVFNIRPVGLFTLSNMARPLHFVRLLWCVWLGKVGFESEWTDRAANVQYSIRERVGLTVRVDRVVSVKVFMYRAIESAVHRYMNTLALRSGHLQGCSGWTEIFYKVNPLCMLLMLIAGYSFGWTLTVFLALAILFTPYPLDMVFCVLLLACVEYALYLTAVYVAYLLSAAIIGMI